MKKINKCVKLILLVICIALICPIITNANVEEDYNFLYESNDREGNGFFWEASTKTLTITDLNDSNATLYLPYDATIDIEGNKQNTVSAIFARDLTVKGNNTASLNVVGYYENTASPAKSSIYVSRCFVMESGNLTINNPLKSKLTIGIDSHQSIEINGGNLEIHTYNVTMAAPPNDPIYINGGTITGYVDSTGEGVFNQSNFSINENYKCKILYNQTSNSDTTNVKETNKNEISNVYNSKYLKIVPYEDEGIVDKDAIKINNVSVDKSEVEFGDCIKVTFDITSKNDLELGNCSFFEIDTTEKYIQSFKKRFYLEKVNNNQYTCEIPISKEDYAETEFGLTRVCLTDVKGNILDTTNFNECKFNVITHVDENAIVIKDRNLKNAILNLVDKNHNDNISKEEILLLDKLDCTSKYIGDLTGIEYAQNLSELTIDNNHIKDFTPLKQLKMLKKLSIRNNAIKDISTICELSSLTYLDVAKNSITNIDDIVKLSNLTYINISNNSISNINVLHNCSKLTNINASFNKIESLGSLLYTLQKLNVLDISNNNITEIPRIGRTVNLEVLLAEENKISNIDGIKEMPKLYQLDLSDNQIKDLSVFNQYVSTTLKDKLNLDLSYNKIKDISPLSKIKIYVLNLEGNQIEDLEPLSSWPKESMLYGYRQNIDINYSSNIVLGNTIQIDLPNIFKQALNTKMTYYSYYGEDVKIISNDKIASNYTNGTNVIIKPEKLGNQKVTVKISKGTFNETIANIYINVVSSTTNNSIPFKDVKTTDWYASAVKYVYNNNIIKGYDDVTFAPNDKLTRGQLVTILHRMEGSPTITEKTKFSDVQDRTQYYYKAVKWATDKKIVSGYDTGKFGPNDNITREQLAVILNKYTKYKGKNISAINNLNGFKDANKISNYATSQMKWAVGAGVITGNADKTLNPQGTATRAEASAMLYKYCTKVK